MPLIVDKEAIKLQILEAFNRLSDERPLTDISLREIAAEAGMSHTKVLRYFSSKNSLHEASVHWASSFLCAAVDAWFDCHKLSDYVSRQAFLDDFFTYIASGDLPGITPRNIVMTCSLGAYSDEIKAAVREEYEKLYQIFSVRLTEAFGPALTEEEISSVFLMFNGIYFTGFNNALFGGIQPALGMEKLLAK